MSIGGQLPPSAPTSATQPTQPALPMRDRLKQAATQLVDEILEKILTCQSGVPTFCDSNVLDLVKRLRQLNKEIPREETVRQLGSDGEILAEGLKRLQHFLWRRSQGRFVDFHDRVVGTREDPRSDSDIGRIEAAMRQGGRVYAVEGNATI
jgi:hypothetical protein